MATPVAAFKGKVSVAGTSTATTGEACSLVSGKTYQVTSASKRVLDPLVARTWKDGGSAVSASNILSEDPMRGTVTFIPAYTVSGSITLDGSYYPLVTVANVTSAKVDIKLEQADVTSLQGASGAGTRQRVGTLLSADFSLSLADPLDTVIDGGTQTFLAALTGRSNLFLALDLDGGTHDVRAWCTEDSAADTLSPTDVVRGEVTLGNTDLGSSTAPAGISIGAV